MAIRFDTERGLLEWTPERGWQGPASVRAAIRAWPPQREGVTPMGPSVDADETDEVWQYLHAIGAMDIARIRFTILGAPDLPGERLPQGAVI